MGEKAFTVKGLPGRSPAAYRFKTGIPELDKALNGGIPATLTVLVLNDPENDASTFCQQLCWEGLTNDEVCVYITYDHHPDVIRRNMLRFGWNVAPYEQEEDFIIVDCYSGRLGERGVERFWLEKPFDALALLELFRKLERKIRYEKAGRPVRVVLDSFSPLAQVIGFMDTSKIVLKLQSLAKHGIYLGIGVVHKGIHGAAAEFIAKHVSEGVIELYTREEKGQLKQYIRVSKMCLTRFDSSEIEYVLGDEGIVAVPKL